MRTIHTNEIKTNIKEMCIEANYVLSQDVAKRIYEASESEENEIGKKILNQLIQESTFMKFFSVLITSLLDEFIKHTISFSEKICWCIKFSYNTFIHYYYSVKINDSIKSMSY